MIIVKNSKYRPGEDDSRDDGIYLMISFPKDQMPSRKQIMSDDDESEEQEESREASTKVESFKFEGASRVW